MRRSRPDSLAWGFSEPLRYRSHRTSQIENSRAIGSSILGSAPSGAEPNDTSGRRTSPIPHNINHVQLIGFLGKDPEKREVRRIGTNFTALSAPTQHSCKNSNDEWQSKTE